MDTNGHAQGSFNAPGASKANGLYAAAAVPVAAPAPDARAQATGQLQLQLDAHHQQHGRTLWPAPHASSLGHGVYSSKTPGGAVGTATPLQQQQQPPHVMAQTSAAPLPTCDTGATTAPQGAAPAAAGADMLSEAAAATPDITYHVRRMTHTQLMAAAAAYNLRAIGTQDPIADTLRGIEAVADLRPGTQPALAFTLGTVPADSPYFKAWKGVRRGLKPAAAGPAAPLAFKGSSGRSAMRTSQPAGSSDAAPTAAGGAAGGAPRSSQAVAKLTPEQQRWVDKLSAFLGRPVKVPRLAASLPVLDLRALWLEVMSLGGLQAASHANAWPAIADKLQHDAGMASPLQAVYDCYLKPLEAELPSGIRPARALDFIEGRVQQRAAAAARLGSYSSVQHAAEQAAAAFQALEEQQRQQQQQALVDGASDAVQQAAAGSSAATSADANSANAGADGAHAGTTEQQPKAAAAAAAAGPPPPATSQQQAAGSGGQLHPAVLLAAALLQEAALFPADVVQSVRGWGLQPSFCPDRLEACKRAHSAARTARRRSGRDSGRGAHSSDSDEAGSSSEEAPRPGSSSRSDSEAQGAHSGLSDSEDEPAQDAPSRAGSGVADRTGDHHEQPSAGGAEREQLQQARQAQPSVLSDSDEEEVIVLGSGPSSSHGQDSEGAAACMTAENGIGTKRARSVDSSGADDRHGQQGEQQQRQQPGQKEEQIEQHKSARQSSTSPGSKRPRFQTIPLARSASEALAEGVSTMQACTVPPVLPDSQQRQEAAKAQQQQQQQQQAAPVLGATQLQLMEGPVATGAGDAAGQLTAEDAGNQAGHSHQQPASSTSMAAAGAAPGSLREGSVPAVTAAVANKTRLRSSKGLPAGGAVGNVLPEDALTWQAARWLLLVRRALGAGPPGCDKRQVGMPPGDRRPKGVPGGAADSGRAQQRRPPLFGEVEARAGGKRTYKGVTPKCGSCHTCKHPSMKKACLINRDRLAQGLPPILPNS